MTAEDTGFLTPSSVMKGIDFIRAHKVVNGEVLTSKTPLAHLKVVADSIFYVKLENGTMLASTPVGDGTHELKAGPEELGTSRTFQFLSIGWYFGMFHVSETVKVKVTYPLDEEKRHIPWRQLLLIALIVAIYLFVGAYMLTHPGYTVPHGF